MSEIYFHLSSRLETNLQGTVFYIVEDKPQILVSEILNRIIINRSIDGITHRPSVHILVNIFSPPNKLRNFHFREHDDPATEDATRRKSSNRKNETSGAEDNNSSCKSCTITGAFCYDIGRSINCEENNPTR